ASRLGCGNKAEGRESRTPDDRGRLAPLAGEGRGGVVTRSVPGRVHLCPLLCGHRSQLARRRPCDQLSSSSQITYFAPSKLLISLVCESTLCIKVCIYEGNIMAALIERSDQLVSLTDLTRRGSGIFDKVASAKNDRLVVLRKAEPIAVVLNIASFEAMLNEMEQLRTEVMALHRMGGSSNDRITHSELQQSLGF